MSTPRRALLVALVLVAQPQDVAGAGFFLAPRGVHPLARAGAYVAGAEGAAALGYNPAGIAMTAGQVLIEAGLPWHRTLYRRQVFAHSEPLETVEGEGLGLPSPALAATSRLPPIFSLPQLHVGLGLLADYPLFQNWPTTLDDGSPAPQRYAIHNYHGTAMMKAVLALAYRHARYGSLGVAFGLLGGAFASEVTASICDGVVCTQPENPDYDAVIQMAAQNIVVPGWQVGLIATPLWWLRLGLAWESGYTVEQEADLRVRLPSASLFDGAVLEPDNPRGVVKLRLPMQLRAGAELRSERGRLELAFVYEPWSVHERIDVDTRGAVVKNVTALGDYPMSAVSMPRHFRDTYSVRLGGVWLPRLAWAPALRLRAGVMWEPSAVPLEYLTAMTVDLDKIIAAVGVGWEIGRWRLDATWAHVFFLPAVVGNSRAMQVNPTRPPWQGRTPIGNGAYAARADIVGIAASLRL